VQSTQSSLHKMPSQSLNLVFVLLPCLLISISSFVASPAPLATIRSKKALFHASITKSEDPILNQLLEELETIDTGSTNDAAKSSERANDLLDELIATSSSSNTATATDDTTTERPDFDALMGYYNVSYTRTARAGDNPVGGKWTRSPRFWKIRRTLQHILPVAAAVNNSNNQTSALAAVAQAVNVIRLDLLGGIVPIWIVLRGDVVPLSQEKDPGSSLSKTPLIPNLTNRAIRAYFDRPRIAIGRFAFSLGPTSSVVIDTPYVDDRLRVGIGGTSGTKFVFKRIIGEEDDLEATEEWKWLLNRTSKSMITKRKLAMGLALSSGLSSWAFWISLFGSFKKALVWKLVACLSTLASTAGLAMVLSSTGGIETDSDTYARGKKL
jgi:hypothetical protein